MRQPGFLCSEIISVRKKSRLRVVKAPPHPQRNQLCHVSPPNHLTPDLLTWISILPPNIKFVLDNIPAQKPGGTLLAHGEFREFLRVKGNGVILIPGFLGRVAHGGSSLFALLGQILIPPVLVLFWHLV